MNFTKVTLTKIVLTVSVLTFIISSQLSIAAEPTFTGSNTNGTTFSGSNSTTFTLKNPLKVNSIGEAVQTFVEAFSYLAILFAVLMLIWTGFQFIWARGNVERMKELKNQLFWIVVGVAVIIGARVIITIVINTLQATGTVEPGTIQSVNKALNN